MFNQLLNLFCNKTLTLNRLAGQFAPPVILQTCAFQRKCEALVKGTVKQIEKVLTNDR